MIYKRFIPVILIALFIIQHIAFAVDVAPRISDREIVESLTEVRGDIKKLDIRIDDFRSETNNRFAEVNKRIDDLRSEMNSKFADLRSEMNSRFVEVNHRFQEVDNRFDTLQWMLGLFITIALVLFGFILRMQWQMHRRQAQMETLLETQRDELSFIKSLIEKFLPPKGVL